jgi:hypothetical protein
MALAAGASDVQHAAPYVPRLALERALAELSEGIGKTPACAALTGASGLGKTRLLHVLCERLSGGFECHYLSFPALGANEFWSGVSAAVGLGNGDEDRSVVLGRARSLHGDGSGLVLLIDDAGGISAERVNDLVDACATPGLSIVLALRGDELAEGVTLPDLLRRIDLGAPLSLSEARAYAQARLRHLDPGGALAARLTPHALGELHEASGGIPARLDALLCAWHGDRETHASEATPAGGAAVDPVERLRAAARDRHPFHAPTPIERAQLRLTQPLVRLGLSTLFVLLIGGFWYFALQRGGNGTSIGVPVEQFRARGEANAPVRAPAHEATAAEPEGLAVPTPATEPENATPDAAAATPEPETPRESVRRLIGSFLELAGLGHG